MNTRSSRRSVSPARGGHATLGAAVSIGFAAAPLALMLWALPQSGCDIF